jgi:hypothetical protein
MTSLSVADNGKVPLGLLIRQLLNAVVTRYMLIPRYGVTWFRLYVFACIVLAAVSAAGWRTINSVLITLSVSSLLFIALWWFQFVSGMHMLSPTSALQLVPRYRRALIVLVVASWLMTAMLLATFFIFYEWFFVSVLAFMFASSLSTEKERLLAIVLISLLILIAIFIGYDNDMLRIFRQKDNLLLNIETGVTLWASFAGILALLGVTRTMPLVAVIIWVVWIGAMLFSTPIFGMSFHDLLNIIYNASTQMFTVVITALMLFGLMMHGLIGKSLDPRLLGVGNDNKSGVLALFANSSWRKKSIWQTLPGYDYFLARRLERPFSFQLMLAFMFGRLGHWTSMLWCGVIISLVLCFWIYKMPKSNLLSDDMFKVWIDTNLCMFAYMYVLSFANNMTSYLLIAFSRHYAENRILSLAPSWPNIVRVRCCLLMFLIKNAVIYLLIGVLAIVACLAIFGTTIDWVASLFWYPFVILLSGALAMLIGVLRSDAPITAHKSTAGSTASGQVIVVLLLMCAPGLSLFVLRANSVPTIFVLESIAIIYCVVLLVRVRRFLNSDKKIFSVA